MTDFKKLFDNGDINEIISSKEGKLWLALRAVQRKDLLEKIAKAFNITLSSKKIGDSFNEILDVLLAKNGDVFGDLMKEISIISQEEDKELPNQIENITSNLYKVTNFQWGGDWRNSLDKWLVTQYVKTDSIIAYDALLSSCQNEVSAAAGNYVISSWYNYWSSVLIEGIFREHQKVVGAPGKIKNVDFFVENYPFDLKVTYLPQEFFAKLYQKTFRKSEISFLKQSAKTLSIDFDKTATTANIFYEIEARISDKAGVDSAARKVLAEIHSRREIITRQIIDNYRDLITWLYENQGDMRFGAENRIFVILVDSINPRNAWSLKRNVALLRPKIFDFLDNFSLKSLPDMKVDFTYNGKVYHSYSEAIFIEK